MKLLLHSCCAPCTIYPLIKLGEEGYKIEVLFYNPNIHPFTEYRNRLNSLKDFLKDKDIRLHIPEEYELKTFFRKVVNNESKRCLSCYQIRIDFSINYMKNHGFDAFSTTLLYSKYQNHDFIKKYAEMECRKDELDFAYADFRKGWQDGIDESIRLEMYRQKYCGCLYSEQERFDNRWKKRQRKLKGSLNN
ncbi:MAG: hypothetical protein CSB24_01790 [Deltaproteobacteria bacterium]|nr:MAG: hypothetical protein CSB24_01790 [Deltaproteobacteria bacterium]